MVSNGHASERLLAGRYRLLSSVGQGGMGTVWRAHDELLGRDVAVKEVLLPIGLPDGEREVLRERMFREARTAARLSHPSVVTIYDVVEEDDRPWIVMEFVRARSLADVIRGDGPLSPIRAAEIGTQMLGALRTAHEAGILHRDVKPSNVLVADGNRVVLTDFGIATSRGDATITQTGMVLGSPAYIAPERARGRPASPASDLWSFGVTLYAMTEGRSPFERTDAVSSMTAVLTDDPEPARRSGPLRPVIDGLLRKDPEARLSSSEALRLVGRAAQATAPLPEPEATTPQPVVTQEAPPPPVADPIPAHPLPDATPPGGMSAARLSAARRPSAGGPGTRKPSGGARRFVIIALAVAAAVLAVTGLRALSNGDEDGADPGKRPSGSATSPRTSPSRPQLRTHQDKTGFKIGAPAGWSGPRRDGSSVFFDSRDGSYIQVDQTNNPGPDALADWKAQEARQRGGDFPAYRRVRLENISYKGSKTAADWEFSWDSQRYGRRHGLNRGFVLNGRGYAIFIVTPEDRWRSGANWRTAVYESFTPAS